MANTMKKLLSLVIALVMVLSLIPAVSAEEATETTWTPNPSTTYEADQWIEITSGEELQAYLTNNGTTNEKSINVEANKNKTIGFRLMNDITTEQDAGTNYYAVLYVGYYNSDATLAFPVNVVLDLNGHTITDTSNNNRMIGVYTGSSLVITNGTINADGIYYSNGGMIFCSGACDVTMDAVNIRANSGCKDADNRSGNISNVGSAGGSLTVKNSKIEVYETVYTEGTKINRAKYGGMFAVGYAVPVTLSNSEFIGGYAVSGGQISVTSGATVTVTDCTFKNGTAETYGGMMYVGSQNAKVTLEGCTFTGGTAASGGQIATVTSPTITATDCTFTGGSATAGGCAYIYSQSSQSKSPQVTFTSCQISGGEATNGGGGNFYVGNKSNYYPAYLTLNSCDVSGGDATTASSKFGGNIYGSGNSVEVDGEAAITTITINGGTISGGKAAYGGNIGAAGSTKIELKGGVQISGGTATSGGGNFYSGNENVIVDLIDATFSGGTAVTGGNVRPNAGTFNMYGGTITGGEASKTANLLYTAAKGTVNIYGGTLEHTEADNALYSDGALNIYNATVNGFDPSEYAVADHSTATQIEGTSNWVVTHNDVEGGTTNTATCTTAGTKTIVCGTCNYTYEYASEALGHAWDDGEVTTAATCKEAGVKTYTCTVENCDATYTEDIPVSETHTGEEVPVPGKPANCTEDGLTDGATCSVCGKVIVEQKTIPSSGHDYESVYTAPTFEADGYTTYTCSACGDSYIETEENSKLTAVATADGVNYETLQAAVDAGGKVVLLQDAAVEEALLITKDVELDLAGYSITAKNETSAIKVDGANIQVTVTGNGTVTGANAAVLVVDGNVTIANGTYNSTGNANGFDYGTVYVYSEAADKNGSVTVEGGTVNGLAGDTYAIRCCAGTVTVNGGTVHGATMACCQGVMNIQGGSFSSDDKWSDTEADILYVYNPDCNCGLGVVNVTGGTFAGQNPAAASISATETTSYVPEGYTVKEENGIYSVVAKTYAKIVEDPASTTVNVGETAQISVVAEGDGLTYLWLYQRPTMAGSDTWYYWAEPQENLAAIDVPATAARDGYSFKCVITDAYGNSATSEAATLTVETDGAIVITKDLVDATAIAGEQVEFAVEAAGKDLTYLWQYKRSGSTSWYYWTNPSKDVTFITVDATMARNGYSFRCILTDANGVQASTKEVQLTVTPAINSATVEADVENGQFTLSADVGGTELTYLWLYQRPSMVENDAWYYWKEPGDYSTITGSTAGRDGYRFKCVITDANGSEVTTAIYELKNGVLEEVKASEEA